jgi:hypothetical protein
VPQVRDHGAAQLVADPVAYTAAVWRRDGCIMAFGHTDNGAASLFPFVVVSAVMLTAL